MSNRFSELIEEARSGSDSAATELVETYQPHIIRAVRRKMAREIRSKFDSDDFAQAVWTSFFRNRSSLLVAESPEQLIGLLATMARNKVIDELRRCMDTKKYDVHRETSLDVRRHDTQQKSNGAGTPSQHIMAREKLERLLRPLPEQHRQVVLLRMEGLTYDEIAEREDVSHRTVRRILKRLFDER